MIFSGFCNSLEMARNHSFAVGRLMAVHSGVNCNCGIAQARCFGLSRSSKAWVSRASCRPFRFLPQSCPLQFARQIRDELLRVSQNPRPLVPGRKLCRIVERIVVLRNSSIKVCGLTNVSLARRLAAQNVDEKHARLLQLYENSLQISEGCKAPPAGLEPATNGLIRRGGLLYQLSYIISAFSHSRPTPDLNHFSRRIASERVANCSE